MAEGTHITGTPACGEWETLLADALDGLLKPEEEARFLAHKAGCPACAALYEAARKGREWLEFLSPEPEPPEWLLEKILATTGPGHSGSSLPVPAAAGVVPAFVPPVWQQPGFFGRMRMSVQPRLLMTAAMAFFSIALTLNLAGVRLSNLRLADLRPRAMRSLHGAATDHGFGADRALLRPSALCVRGGSAHARTARPG
jgi:anti-sigma factor RsiW